MEVREEVSFLSPASWSSATHLSGAVRQSPQRPTAKNKTLGALPHARRKGYTAIVTIEQIGANVGKNPSYVASRARLTELIPAVVEAFYAEEIGIGHALLLAKLQPPNRKPLLLAAFVRIGVAQQGRPSASSFPSAISSTG